MLHKDYTGCSAVFCVCILLPLLPTDMSVVNLEMCWLASEVVGWSNKPSRGMPSVFHVYSLGQISCVRLFLGIFFAERATLRKMASLLHITLTLAGLLYSTQALSRNKIIMHCLAPVTYLKPLPSFPCFRHAAVWIAQHSSKIGLCVLCWTLALFQAFILSLKKWHTS